MMLRRTVAALSLGVLGVLALEAPAQAAPAAGTLTFSGALGDYLTGGGSYSYVGPSDQVDLSGDAHHVTVGISGANGDWWSLDVAAPPGASLTAGTTYAATRYPFNAGPGFDLSGNGRGCSASTSTVTVDAIDLDDLGAVTRLAATFEQRCTGATATTRGQLDVSVAPAATALELGVTTTRARIDASGGVAVSGTLTCTSDTAVAVSVVVTQQAAADSLEGTASTDVDCRTGLTVPWTAYADDAPSPFTAAGARVTSTATATDAWTGAEASATDSDLLPLAPTPAP